MRFAIPTISRLSAASVAFAASGVEHRGLAKRFTSTNPYVSVSGSTCTVTVSALPTTHDLYELRRAN